MKTHFTIPALLMLASLPASATLTVLQNTVNPATIPGITDLQTRSALAGAYVTFSFFGVPLQLTSTIDASGNAFTSDPNIFLTMNSAGIPDTNSGVWTITNNTPLLLNFISIVGFGPNSANNTAFDLTTPAPGTSGSSPAGQTITCSGPCPSLSIGALYTRPLNLPSQTSAGDLYGELQISIVNGAITAGPNSTFSFFADTDIVSSSVPEPLTYATLGAALLAFSLLRHRRNIQ